MDWEKVALAVGGFLSGMLTVLVKLFMPGYVDLYKENQELRERVREIEDSQRDELESRDREEETLREEIHALKSKLEAISTRQRRRD